MHMQLPTNSNSAQNERCSYRSVYSELRRILATLLLAALGIGLALAATRDTTSVRPTGVPPIAAPLQPEVSDTATLPPHTPHRVWLIELYSGQTQIVDGDSGSLLGSLYAASLSNYISAADHKFVYVAESIWSRGNRGVRQDLLTIYDGTTLKLQAEIALPGRIYEAPKMHNFALNSAGTRAYVYNMQPAASVVVVDLKRRKILRSIDTPGCALVFAWDDDAFSSLCGNGSLATVVEATARPTLSRSEPFFDAANDPIFEESLSNAADGEALFVTFSGVVHPVQLAATPRFGRAWSLQQAAGLEAASLAPGSLAWRPGGRLPMAFHRASSRLYVLMHAGEPWSHKDPGTELWVVDTQARSVVRRMKLETPVGAIATSQDSKPLLFMVDSKQSLSIRDANTLIETRKIDNVRGVVPYVPPFAP